MKLYNTLTKKIEDVKPLQPPAVTVYTCGPTVYDYPHIGNWFTFIRYDLLMRTLRLEELQPKWVLNITDVGHLVSDADDGEDKLEKGARRESKTAWDIAKFYGDNFIEGLAKLNITKPDYLPKATDHIEEQIALVKVLEEKGYTYTIDDGVYFDTSKFPHYADFAQLDVDEQQAGKRVELNSQKRNPTDFALWKFSPVDQQRDMEWDNPFGRKGFPGWHIECSAMSMKYLGETMDIHAGGIDHIPVHHTNEIAQSEAATGKRFANYWMHANHITIEGDKVSKSLGNGITLEDIEARGYNLAAFRLHVLESHYRSQSKFSWDSLEAAKNRLNSLQAMADLRWQEYPDDMSDDDQAEFLTLVSETLPTTLRHYMRSDLDTPKALAALSEAEDDIDQSYHQSVKAEFVIFLQLLDDMFGFTLLQSSDISDDAKQLISQREIARQSKDWTESDRLRNELSSQGIGLRDSKRGVIWYRL